MGTTFRVASPDVIHETIEDEVILIDLKTGMYYSLRDAGSAIWQAIEQGADEESLLRVLERRFDASREDLEAAVAELLGELQREGLIRADAGPPAQAGGTPSADGSPPARVPWRAPKLEKHTDMQDLILIDPVHEVSSAGWPHLPEATEAST